MQVTLNFNKKSSCVYAYFLSFRKYKRGFRVKTPLLTPWVYQSVVAWVQFLRLEKKCKRNRNLFFHFFIFPLFHFSIFPFLGFPNACFSRVKVSEVCFKTFNILY